MSIREPPELDTSASVSPKGLLKALKVGLVILSSIAAFLLLVVKVSSWFRLDFDATFWNAAGIVLLSCTLIRPWWFWYHAKALFLRSVLGDTGTMLLYVGITGSIIVTGVRRQVAINRARAECAKQLAAAKDTQERVRVLYHGGAAHLPRSDREPGAMSCERLLHSGS